jgi:hypothetical protein
MRILLVHPDDDAPRGPWSGQPWDFVLDLGRGGVQTYERWSAQFRCPAAPLGQIEAEGFQMIRGLLAAGIGRMRDRENLDWWELIAILLQPKMEALIRLRRFVDGLAAADQVFVTRPGFHADAVRLLLGERLHCFSDRFRSLARRPTHYAKSLARFSLSQMAEIFGDKYDASYAIRGSLTRRRTPSPKPVVLLPSAYVNVSRLGLGYAEALPETDFLLVNTRQSGWVERLPANVTAARLASYASPGPAPLTEYKGLLESWRRLRRELEKISEISLLGRLGCLDFFPKQLRQSLAVRDAWRAVFESEPVKAVLCGDDSNPYTHLPLLLARNRGIPALACHHGAFDGRCLFKRSHADTILAKGRMEEDYLLRVCGLPRDSVEIGAPAGRLPARKVDGIAAADRCPFIVFFSEAYEVLSGRVEEFYRDVLPPLADLARRTQRQLVIKLHPFESHRERQKLAKRVLTGEQQRFVTVVSGPLTDDLLQKTWFSMTILSTVAMECALRGIPCFLAAWLEYWPCGYIEQFNKFGVGYLLRSPAEISGIPDIMENYRVDPELAPEIWQPISPARFQELICGSRQLEKAVAV